MLSMLNSGLRGLWGSWREADSLAELIGIVLPWQIKKETQQNLNH